MNFKMIKELDKKKKLYEKEYLRKKKFCREYYKSIKVIGCNPFYSMIMGLLKERNTRNVSDLNIYNTV